jgi:transposase
MGAEADVARLMAPQLELLLPHLDERSRRLVLGSVALAAGAAGVTAVARASGASWQTVADGAAELESGQVVQGRVRRPGAGRKRAEDNDPQLVPALLALVEDGKRGDPQSPLSWTTKSLRHLSGELGRQGHRCSPDTVARLLHEQGFSLQANAKTIEGKQHPDRDAQFRYISEQARAHMAGGQPVISVDAKKKEQAGQYGNAGREWRPAGDPVRVRDHDFPDEQAGKVTPYGVYDIAANAGFVNVGTDHDTAAFAVESIRCWWNTAGRDRYPGARRLLVTADAGGSNGYRTRTWKTGMAALAAETGLEITCCHFPPGTSKWNKIEHRLFAQISKNWRARPLASHEVIIATIAATTTATGLAVTAALDERAYPTGIRVTGAQIRQLEDTGALTRHGFCGAWNYTLHPAPAASPAPPGHDPAPQPADPPAAPARCDQATLSHPALTGRDHGDLAALTAQLAIPWQARREQQLYQRRGRPRRRAARPDAPRKLDLTDHILATLLQLRFRLPAVAMAPLFGADQTTVSQAIKHTRELMNQHRITITPGPARPRTLDDFRTYAATAGLTIPPQLTATAAALTTPATHDTPEIQLISRRLHWGSDSPRSSSPPANPGCAWPTGRGRWVCRRWT